MLRRIVVLIAIAGLSLSLGACKKDNLVIIKYKQPANCFLFDKCPTCSPHDTAHAQNGMFVIYKITAIQNTAKDATDFNFKLSKLYASDTGEVSGNTGLDQYVKTAPDSKLVPKGTTANNIGRIMILVKGAQKQSFQPLYYNSSQGESVLVVNEDLGQPNPPLPKFLDPCTPNNLP